MLSTKLSPDIIANFRKRFSSFSPSESFYEELCNHRYKIYTSFDTINGILSYDIFSMDEDTYFYIEISALEKVSILSNHAYKGKSNYSDKEVILFSQAFFVYLYDQEIHFSEEEKKKRYGKNYYSLLPFMNHTAEENAIRINQEYLLHNLVDSIYDAEKKDNPENEKQEVTLPKEKIYFFYDITEYSYFSTRPYSLRIKVRKESDKRFTFITDLPLFLDGIREGRGTIVSNSKEYDFSKEVIEEKDFLFLTKVAKENPGTSEYAAYSYSTDGINITTNTMMDCLTINEGRTISFNDSDYTVYPKEQEVSINVDENGKMAFTPDIHDSLIIGESKLANVSDNEIIYIYRFPDNKAQALFDFAASHPDFRFDLFADQISSEVLPALKENMVAVSDKFKEKYPFKRQTIHYIVTYNEEGILTFQTEYYFDKGKTTQEEFIGYGKGADIEDKFEAELEKLSLPKNGEIKDLESIVAFLSADLSDLKKTCDIYLSDNIAKTKVKGVGKISIFTSSGINWLQMRIGSPEYTDDELATILTAYKKKRKYVKLNDTIISFEDSDSASFKEMVSDFNIDEINTPRLPIYDALKLSAYASDEADILYSPELKSLFEDIKNFPSEEADIPSSIEEKLRPYQKDGVKWLHVLSRHNLSGILADDMGLGKTLEMIALLSTSKEEKPILVVTPKSLIYNWEREFHQWDPSVDVTVLDGNKESRNSIYSSINQDKKDIYVISYESLRNDLDELVPYTFSYVILDEAQSISNVFAKKTKAVKKIQADHKFVLTGTPIQNSYMDLWSIFDFLMPGYLPSYHDFQKIYLANTEDEEMQAKIKKDLSAKIAPFILKRKKEDVLKDLPPKTESIITVGMAPRQRELYDASLQDAQRDLSQRIDKITILSEITRLREICVNPKMAFEDYPEESEKLLAAREMIRQAINDGHKVLVFSTFVKTLDSLEKLLEEIGIHSEQIVGDTPAKTRLSLADRFNTSDDLKVMLVSLKAGGTGLNLIGADIVLHLDPWWNLAAEEQANDRTHRIGQTRPVTVMKMICKDSIEERIIELQQKKKDLTSVIQDGEDAITGLDLSDLQFLLS